MASAASNGKILSLKERLRLRDAFFRKVPVDPRQFLQAFDHIPGLLYFVKDIHGRQMLSSREYIKRMGYQSEEDTVGKLAREYLAKDLVDQYEADDQRIYRSGQPLRNIIEMGFNDQGVRDWIITDKYPIRDSRGRVVGIIGTIQSFAARRKMLASLGEVGKAADFIHDNLGARMPLSAVAAHVGLSERHLQRLFHKVFGMTMQRFIIHSRVHAAAHELTHSQRSISEIALMFGFNDQSALTNQFKELTGLPPRAYRQRYLSEIIP